MNRIRTKLTYANVMSTLAVILVIGGGTAWAAGLGRNSVHSRNIAPGAVKTSDLANGAVNADRLKANAVTGTKIADNAVDARQIADNVVGARHLADGSVGAGKLASDLQGKLNTLQTSNVVRADVTGTSEATSPELPLLSHGPFRMYAKCWTDPGNVTVARTYVATTIPGTLASGTSTTYHGANGFYLDPSTVEINRRITNLGVTPTNANFFGGGATMIAGSKSVGFSVTGFAKGASVASDATNYGAGSGKCVFSSSLVDYSD